MGGKERADLRGLSECRRAIRRVGQRFDGCGEHTVFGDHFVHRVGQVRTGGGRAVDGELFRHCVGDYLLGEVGNEFGYRGLVSDSRVHGFGQRSDPVIDVRHERAVVLKHRFEGFDLSDCHDFPLLLPVGEGSRIRDESRGPDFLG